MACFETHLTFQIEAEADLWWLKDQGKSLGLKCTHIVLDRGNHVSQPMLTRHSEGSLEGEIESAQQLASELSTDSIRPNRIKLEVAADSELVPQAESDPRLCNETYYFEYHIKFSADRSYQLSLLEDAVAKTGARLSRNDFKSDGDEVQRFVTLRAFHCLGDEAEKQFQSTYRLVTAEPVSVLEVEKEYVVYDSNFNLDEGWLEI